MKINSMLIREKKKRTSNHPSIVGPSIAVQIKCSIGVVYTQSYYIYRKKRKKAIMHMSPGPTAHCEKNRRIKANKVGQAQR
jgi:hypothetical protein